MKAFEKPADFNQALYGTGESRWDGRIAGLAEFQNAYEIPEKVIRQAAIVGLIRTISADTASSKGSPDSIAKIIALWREGYLKGSFRPDTKAATGTKKANPWVARRLELQSAIRAEFPKKDSEKLMAALEPVERLDDEKFALWIEARSQGENANKYLISAIAKLEKADAEKAERERQAAIAEIESLGF